MDPTGTEADHRARVRQAVQAAHTEISATRPAAEIARAVRESRAALGWTQEQLAAAAGIYRTPALVDLEGATARDHNPLTLVAVARALGRPFDWLGATAPATILPGSGRALAIARIAVGMTIEALATASGISASSIYKIEHGKMTGTRRLWKDLGAALAVDPADLWPPYASR